MTSVKWAGPGRGYVTGMMPPASLIPRFPPVGAWALAPLPLFPLTAMLGRTVRSMVARNPGLFARLGDHANKRFLIDPTDLPFFFLLRPGPDRPRIDALRRSSVPVHDCLIAGPLAALVGMVHGAYDGDALFFSRDIVFEGDTEAALALRNAIDDAELDLFDEAVFSLGALGELACTRLRPLARLSGRLTGVAVTRQEELA